jgi:hypothetical protein
LSDRLVWLSTERARFSTERDVGGFHRRLCTADAHPNSYVCCGESRRVVDAVSDHGEALSSCLNLGSGFYLGFRHELGSDVVDPELPATVLAVAWLSPVNMTTRSMPVALRRAIASLAPG